MEFIINLVVTAALVGLLYLYFNNKIRKALDAQNLLSEVRDEVDSLVRELNLSAERNILLIEEKIKDLERTLSQADQKMTLLTKETARSRTSQEVYTHLAKAKAPVILTPEPEPETEPVPVPVKVGPKPLPQESLFAEEEIPAVKPLKLRVLEMAQMGAAPQLIATQTGASLAEVDLILSLGGRRANP